MNEVKRIKPVRINAVSFAERFKGREVKLLKGYNADGSRRINHGIISNAIVIEKDIYCVVVCEKVLIIVLLNGLFIVEMISLNNYYFV